MKNLRILSIAVLLLLVGCTSDDQAKATSPDTRPAQEQTQQESQQVAQNDTPAEPEKPAEPQMETITTYHFTSATERNSVDCQKTGEALACGVSYRDCGSKQEDSYDCQTGVHEWSTSREQLVKDN